MLNTVNDDNTDQDTGGVETPTAKEDNSKPVMQELQNSIVMKHIPMIDQRSHVIQLSEIVFSSNQGIGPTLQLSPQNPCTLGEDCHSLSKSWSVTSIRSASSTWLTTSQLP